jgi:hypothetical protein
VTSAVLFNAAGNSASSGTISFGFDELQWQGKPALASAKNCHVQSVWDDGKELGVLSGGFSVEVNGSAAFFAIVSGCDGSD